MGLFTNTQPQVMTAAQGAAQAGQFLTQALDPVVESFGYQSQENQILDIIKGVDSGDVASFKAAYDKILGINPEAAAEFKAQSMPMLKDLQAYEGKSLEIQALKNKPQLQAQWQYQARPNFMSTWLKSKYGIDISPSIITIEDITKAIRKDAGDDRGLSGQLKKDFMVELKLSRETFLTTNALTDFGTEGTMGLSFPSGDADFSAGSKDVVDIDGISGEGAGYSEEGTIDQVNPESSGFSRFWQGSHAKAQVRGRVSNIANQLSPAVFGSLTLSVEEEKLNTRNKPAFTWFTTKGRDYFIRNPKELAKAEKNPLVWYETKFKKK
jgi:hypothetical protein